ncbi:MAG: efflux RND transporter permease subunit [Deltaproteobacteria bacterium]|nr:efflux RND transporter permease subunit [Deltaproteobacteria bacterium]
MLNGLIDLSLRHRLVVLLAAAALVVTGLLALRDLPLDAYPDTTPVQVTVNATAPALSPEEVERQLTFPLEQVLGGLPALQTMRSVSKFGFSQVTLVFEEGADVWRARQAVSERLLAVELPEGVGRPTLGPVSTGLGEVFQYLVRGDERWDATELRTLQDWVIRPQLLSVPGVAEVNTWGGYERQLQVVVEPDLLVKHDLTMEQVEQALRRNNASVGGGVLDQAGETWLIQGMGLAATATDVRDIVIDATDGRPVHIADVARVEEGHEIRRGAVTAEGEGEVVLGLGFMLMGGNSREVTTALEQRLTEAAASLPDGVSLEPVYSRTELVDHVLGTVEENLFLGGLIVVGILFAFLGNVRAGLIVALAIPLSMLFAFEGMLRFGIAGSLMSLGAIDFGLVVDSSVIMVENVERRLASDRSGRSVLEIVRDAAVEVRRPTLFGELIIAIVYLPILTLEGVEGQLFRPMALTVVLALLGSMVLSLTLMPVLASLVLRRGGHGGQTRLVRGIGRLYAPVLAWALHRRGLVLGVAGLVLVNALLLGATLGAEFVPRLREGAVVVNTVRLAGVSLDESIRYGTRIEEALLTAFPDEVAHIWTRTGTAEVATDPMGTELSDVFMTLTPRSQWTRAATQDELVTAMAAELEGLPGMRAIFTQPIEMRMNEMIAGIRADVGIKLYGDDFDVLGEQAREIQRVVETIDGAADVTTEQLTGLPVLRVEIDRAALGRFGIPAEAVLEVVEALGTRKVGEIREGQTRYDLALRLDEDSRRDPEAIGRILVSAPGGERVPLSRLTTIRLDEGPATVQREWGKRRVLVQANVRGRDVASFVDDVRASVGELSLPSGVYVRYGGQFEHLERARSRLAVVVPLALLLVFALLYLSLGSMRDAVLVMSGVPFATVGGIVALWLRDLPFSISAGVGFVALSGVAVLGQLVLVSRIRQVRDRGGGLLDSIRDAAETRLRPVLMTGLVASLGFLPMAFNTSVGAEVQRPLATVVLGGVLTSTLATLVVLPALYAVFGGQRAPKAPREAFVEGAAAP